MLRILVCVCQKADAHWKGKFIPLLLSRADSSFPRVLQFSGKAQAAGRSIKLGASERPLKEKDRERAMEGRQKQTLTVAEKFVEAKMAGRDASHDAAHAFRVRDLALSLALEEGLESHSLEIVELAALLHDIGDYKYNKDFIEDTKIVENFLEEVGLEESQRKKILDIIKRMGFKNELQKTCIDSSLEFGVVQDADRLDAIGAIGIARCFTYGGSTNQILHDPEISPRQNLSKEMYMNKADKQTTINHFHEKLFKLKDMMKTEAGRRRAEKRHKFMENFIEEFYEEWSGRA